MAKFNDYLKATLMIVLLLYLIPFVLKRFKQDWLDSLEPRNLVGCLAIHQPLYATDWYSQELERFFKDAEIKAILLNIDCPGGAAGASQALALRIEQLKKEYPKPVVAYSENICTSGAYEVAIAADYIVTTGSCTVGSIGSKLCTQFKIKQLLEQYNIKTHNISSGAYKDALDPCVDLTLQQKTMLQELSDDAYEQFIGDVAKKRHLSLQTADSWANGRVFTGSVALKLKLVDALGNQTTALDYIKQSILHADWPIVLVTTKRPSRWLQWLYGADDDDGQLDCNAWQSFFTALVRALQNI